MLKKVNDTMINAVCLDNDWPTVDYERWDNKPNQNLIEETK